MAVPLKEAYDYLFGVVSRTYAERNEYPQELVGIRFDDDGMSELHVLTVDSPMKHAIPSVIDKMLLDYPLVAHLAEALASPSGNPEHQVNVILFSFYTEGGITIAACPIRQEGAILQGVLEHVISQAGTPFRDVPVRH